MVCKLMSNSMVQGVNFDDNWDSAVEECLRMVAEHEAAAARLRTSVEYFESRKKSGDPFPSIDRLKERGLVPDQG